LKPFYEDKLEEPRKTGVDGSTLPNARSIALLIHDPMDTPTGITHLGVMFGQFVDHDFAQTASTGFGSSPLKCSCTSGSSDCFNIQTPDDDIFNDQECMTMTRSAASFDRFDCTVNNREQTNLLTHWLDLSQMYGTDSSTSSSLRTNVDGLMKSSTIGGSTRDFLPKSTPGKCVDEEGDQLCFEAGDSRTSQNLMLVSIHTIWLREHNRVARALKRLNPTWTDDDLFEEARRIVIAEYQHILYNEWLPIILGPDIMKAFELEPLKTGHFMRYDESVNPHLSTEFSTAAFRFGHSLVRSTLSKTDDSLIQFSNLTLQSIMLRPVEAYTNGGLDSICRGLLVDPGTSFDAHFTDELQNHLFETGASDAQTRRFSLSAVNINRGRDHGIAPYNEFRPVAGLKKAASFDDLVEIQTDNRDKLKRLYKNVNDIDAFTGGMSEQSIPGALLGPTFAGKI
jgi:peroxidase